MLRADRSIGSKGIYLQEGRPYKKNIFQAIFENLIQRSSDKK